MRAATVQSLHGLLLVQRNVEQALVDSLVGGVLYVSTRVGRTVPEAAGVRALLIPLILDGAVGSDAHMVIAAVRRPPSWRR